MGKIYDALKRAEKEAQINKKNQQATEPEIISNTQALSKTEVNASHDSSELQVKPRPITQIKSTRATLIPQKRILSEGSVIPKKVHRGFPILNILKRTKKGALHNSIGELYTLSKSHHIVAEQYGTLRARVINFCKEKNIRTILVTSTLSGEGKSTVASNLSVSIANSINEHALLVDGDLRRPSIHKIFGLNNDIGLSEYLSEDLSITHTMFKSKIEKLTIVPAGNPPDNPTELLSSDKMIKLTTELKTRYKDRFVIIDSTPAYSTPEPSIIAKYIDCVIFVVKAGNTSRELVQKSIESIGKDKLLGVVFNMANEQLQTYSYNYYYSKQHG